MFRSECHGCGAEPERPTPPSPVHSIHSSTTTCRELSSKRKGHDPIAPASSATSFEQPTLPVTPRGTTVIHLRHGQQLSRPRRQRCQARAAVDLALRAHTIQFFSSPLITCQNRRIRHLHGITIRNLALAQPSSRPRGKTIDDDAIPSTLKTPAKALAQRESRKLEHARSSTDLRARDLHPIGESAANGQSGQDISLDAPVRPNISRLRRRSTMKWSGASPLERQKKLEDVAEGRMANIFFSLHVADNEGQFLRKAMPC